MKTKILFLTVIIFVVKTFAQECVESAVCPYGFRSKKNCGKWWCYGTYENMPMEWRGYWGVTHVCEWTWAGSFAASIHCKEENDWTLAQFKFFFLGLYIPEGIPWAPHHFRWTDGTPVDFTDWSPPHAGSIYQQPHNEVPTERVVDNTGHWHDTISNNPVTHRILCKIAPQKINYCLPPTLPPVTITPTTTKTTSAKSTTPNPTTTTTTEATTLKLTTPKDIILETLPFNDVPALPSTTNPATLKPPIKSCKI